MRALRERFALLKLPWPVDTRNTSSELRSLLTGPSTPKRLTSNVLNLSNEDVVDGMGENIKGLFIDVISKYKVIVTLHEPKKEEENKYNVTNTSKERALCEKGMIQHIMSCVNCGYRAYETDFMITCDKCHKLVHKRCWDTMFDDIFLTERLEWNSNNVESETDRPNLCMACYNHTAGTEKPIMGNNEKIIMYASATSKQPKVQTDMTVLETRSSSKIGDPEETLQKVNQSKDGKLDELEKMAASTSEGHFNRWVSTLISNALDGIGYSMEMIKHRQRMFAEKDLCPHRFKTQPDDRVTTGGKAEGTSMYFENDTDYMFVVKDTVCAEDLGLFEDFEDVILIQIDDEGCSPGYTRLKLVKLDGNHYKDELQKSVVELENGKYLSNIRYLHQVLANDEPSNNNDGFVTVPISGPSTPIIHKLDSFDNVFALRCYTTSWIQQYLSRPRPNNWPTVDDLNMIAQLEAHAVPVGFKGSPNQEFEWRICYSLAELYLMRSLNECQIQMYIALKMLAKSSLQSVSKEITSYVLKNVTLWMCESRPIDDFQKDCLLDRTIDGLKFLLKCLKENFLPSYMISERNLFAGRITDDQKIQLVNLLETLITEGACLFLRIPKINDAIFAMYKVPDSLEDYGKKRNRLERLALLRCWIREDVWVPFLNRRKKFKLAEENLAYLPLENDMVEILSFEDVLKQEGKTLDEMADLWDKTVQIMLS